MLLHKNADPTFPGNRNECTELRTSCMTLAAGMSATQDPPTALPFQLFLDLPRILEYK